MKILLVGGGSGGPVSPLLAVAKTIRSSHSKAEFLFVGGRIGPERQMAETAGLRFRAIISGKLRRYFSFKNIISPFQVCIGFFQALAIMWSFRPDAVFGTGSFVQVPVMWAAKLYGSKIIIHQQDIWPTLANKFCSAIADKITVTFESSLKDFGQGSGIFYHKQPDKVVLTGNPFREELKNATKEEAWQFFKLHAEMPVLYVTGGGTGSQFINNLITENVDQLTKFVQIIHATGVGRGGRIAHDGYHAFEFVSEVQFAYAAADFVLCRAGIGTITELSNLKKIAILVPMPDSHQVFNAMHAMDRRAAVVATEDRLNGKSLIEILRKLMFNLEIQKEVEKNILEFMPHGSAEKIGEIIIHEIVKS